MPWPMSVLWCPITVLTFDPWLGAGQVERRVGLDVEQVSDQREHLRELAAASVLPERLVCTVYSMTRTVGSAARRPCAAGAAGPGKFRRPAPGSGRAEQRRRGPPQDVRPGGQHVADQGVAQKVAVGQHQHPRTERGRHRVAGQSCSPTV